MAGFWIAPAGQISEEDMVRLAVDVSDTPENREFFVGWKAVLKQRFRQEETWIVAISLELV